MPGQLGSNGNARNPRTTVECRPLPLLGGGTFYSIECLTILRE